MDDGDGLVETLRRGARHEAVVAREDDPHARVVEALRGAPVAVVVGGVVPESDRAALHAAGVTAVFGPGSTLPDVARVLLKECESEEREAAAVEY